MSQGEHKPLLVTVPSARRIIDVGNTKFWELVKRGAIEMADVCDRKMVVYASLERLAAGSANKTQRITQPETAHAAA